MLYFRFNVVVTTCYIKIYTIIQYVFIWLKSIEDVKVKITRLLKLITIDLSHVTYGNFVKLIFNLKTNVKLK